MLDKLFDALVLACGLVLATVLSLMLLLGAGLWWWLFGLGFSVFFLAALAGRANREAPH